MSQAGVQVVKVAEVGLHALVIFAVVLRVAAFVDEPDQGVGVQVLQRFARHGGVLLRSGR